MAIRNPIRDQSCIVGVGHSGCFRDAGVPGGTLVARACMQAISDAGLKPTDIDGVITSPMPGIAGYDIINCNYLVEMLGLPSVRWWIDHHVGGVPGLGSACMAALAVSSGMCDVALACRLNWRPKDKGYGHVSSNRAHGVDSFINPYGYGVFPQKFSSWYMRYVHEFGVKREQLGEYVVQSRKNALLNDKPIVAPRQAITMDDYLNARMISDPMNLLDCDFPCDGAAAVIITSPERAKTMKQKPVYISAVATGQGPHPDFVFWPDYTVMAAHWAAKDIWEKAGIARKDINFQQIYDGFAPFIFYWMEALGFAKRGEAHEFVGSGALRPTGVLPTNLNGGQLNEGRLHALGHTVEATLQLQGRAGARQLKKADAAVVSGGGLTVAAIMVLHR